MLSLGKLAPGQQQYYLDTVARGAEEYYVGAREAPGEWIGTAAARLGLSGEVDAADLGRVLEQKHPSGGSRLTGSRSVPVVAGFDVTFCAPKSVSLLFALGDPEVSNEVRNAADAAVAASLEVLERAACRVRRGQGGHTVIDGDGFVTAAFRHRTSRAGDPHLHTHAVLANMAHASSDDRWTALDARPLYSWLAPVGHLHEAHLRWELTRRLGVEWGPVRKGIADIAGIDRAVIREFSTRRREIEAHLEEHGQHSARAAQFATYATRQPKDTNLDSQSLLPEWRERAAAVGLDAETLTSVLGRTESLDPPPRGSARADTLYRWLASSEGLTANTSTFDERDVIKAVCNALPLGGRVDQVLDLADGFLQSEHALAVRADRGTATIRRQDGKVIPARTDEVRFTTPEMLDIEARLVDSALRRRAAGTGVTDPDAIDAAIASRPTLSEEQQAMIRAVCSSGDGIEIVEGVAGAGKTFALAGARDAWRASGYQVIGCSLAARAAKQLQDDAGIPASTIDRFLNKLDRHQHRLDRATVVVVDEAAMVGTRKLGRLLGHADDAGAKVVLVGDSCQLPEIEAGGAFRGLRERLGASHLGENRRQVEPWEREALAELRDGDPIRAVDSYQANDRVHHAASNDQARETMVDEWMRARMRGDEALMVAPRLVDVDDLNRRARQLMREEYYLGPDQVVLNGRRFAEGDQVLALRNNYRIGMLNGTRAAVDQVDLRHQVLRVSTVNDEYFSVPFSYAEAGHLTHGYATTIHKAQGLTVDRCFVLADDTTSREHTYTALSRGRHGNDLYVVTDDQRVDERHAVEVEHDPLDGLRATVQRSGSKELALDQIHKTDAPALDDWVRERDLLRNRLTGAPPDPTWDYQNVAARRRTDQHRLDDARRRRDRAEHDLDQLGPIGRRVHPARRRDIEQRIEGCNNDVDVLDTKVAELERQLAYLEPAVQQWTAWTQTHSAELDRLDTLDQQINITQRLDRVATRHLDRGVERDFGLGL